MWFGKISCPITNISHKIHWRSQPGGCASGVLNRHTHRLRRVIRTSLNRTGFKIDGDYTGPAHHCSCLRSSRRSRLTLQQTKSVLYTQKEPRAAPARLAPAATALNIPLPRALVVICRQALVGYPDGANASTCII